jgi:hypothetical protein
MKMPKQHDLIGFFGSKPALTDDSVPWAYNHLTFSAKSGSDTLIFEVEPASGEIRLRWLQGDHKAVELLLDSADSLTVDDRENALVVRFDQRLGLGALRLRVAPTVSIFWDARSN